MNDTYDTVSFSADTEWQDGSRRATCEAATWRGIWTLDQLIDALDQFPPDMTVGSLYSILTCVQRVTG